MQYWAITLNWTKLKPKFIHSFFRWLLAWFVHFFLFLFVTNLFVYVLIDFFSNAQLFITAPNIFHVGVEETVSVIVYNSHRPVNVTVIAQDYPDKNRNLSAVSGVFTSGIKLIKQLFVRLLIQIREITS